MSFTDVASRHRRYDVVTSSLWRRVKLNSGVGNNRFREWPKPLELAWNESSEHEPSLTAEKVFRKKDFNSAEKIEKVRVKERERE